MSTESNPPYRGVRTREQFKKAASIGHGDPRDTQATLDRGELPNFAYNQDTLLFSGLMELIEQGGTNQQAIDGILRDIAITMDSHLYRGDGIIDALHVNDFVKLDAFADAAEAYIANNTEEPELINWDAFELAIDNIRERAQEHENDLMRAHGIEVDEPQSAQPAQEAEGGIGHKVGEFFNRLYPF